MQLLLENEETERLKFRRLEKTDFDDWVSLFFNENDVKFLGMDNINSPKERCECWFKYTFDRYNNDLGGQNVLIDKKTNKLIGQSGLLVREIDGKREIEVAYSILPIYRGCGFATEAATKCRDFAFSNRLSEQLISIIHEENVASENVAINIGMEKLKSGIFNGMPVNFFHITFDKWDKYNKSSSNS